MKMLFKFTLVPTLVLVLSLLLPAPALAQDEESDSPPVDSEEVDREEAEFRRRMELEEGDDDASSGRPVYSPDIVDVIPEPGPLDHLPPASREHLEDELTELIIATGRWEPTDAAQAAPYTPSAAAQLDPALAAQEQEAWEGMVDAYHEREQAAHAAGSGAAGGAGQGDGSGQGGDGGAGGNTGGSGSGNGDMDSPGSGAPQEPSSREPEDEAFNALDFLRQQGEPATQVPPAGPAASGSKPSGPSEDSQPAAADGELPASGAGTSGDRAGDMELTPESGQDLDAGTPQDSATATTQTPVEASAQESGQDPEQDPAQDVAQDSGQDPGQDQASSPGFGQEVDGSLPAEALDALFSGGSSAGEPEGAGEPNESDPQAASQAPETGFLAWLRRLFGDGAVDDQDDDRDEADEQDDEQEQTPDSDLTGDG